MSNTLSGKVELPDQDDSKIVKVIKKALSTRPEDRFISVEEIVKYLDNIVIVKAAKPRGISRKERLPIKRNVSPRRRRKKKNTSLLFPMLIFFVLCFLCRLLTVPSI